MKAWVIEKYGGPDVLKLTDLSEPTVGDEDVLIEMRATSVNPLDWKIRNGLLKLVRKANFPLAMGSELSGVVLDVGSKVSAFKPGDEVYSRVNKDRTGTWAERIAVHQSHVARKPKNLTFEETAAIPLAGLTAWQCLVERGRLQKGQKVLIHAGAGGVGTLAIQIAAHLEAEIATTASAPKHELLKSLGAHHCIDYRNENFEDVLSDYDLVLEALGNESAKRSVKVLRKGGQIVSIAGALDPQTAEEMGLGWFLRRAIRISSWSVRRAARAGGCTYRFLFMREDGEQLARLTKLIEAGELKATVDKVFPFEETDQAVAYAERGKSTGKVIIKASE